VAVAGAACTGKSGAQGEQGERGEQGTMGERLNYDLGEIKVREQRTTKRFYHVGSPAFTDETPEYGHMGEQAKDSVKVTGSTVRIQTSSYATAVAINVASVFGTDNLADLRMWGNPFHTSTYVDLTAEGNFHIYDTVDEGWGKDHKPAYFVINAPAQGSDRIVKVDVMHKGKISTFHIIIERAAAAE
jgi:hypothetical protein